MLQTTENRLKVHVIPDTPKRNGQDFYFVNLLLFLFVPLTSSIGSDVSPL